MDSKSLKQIEDRHSRLENVQTRWSLFRSTADVSADAAQARNAFVLRYSAPIRGYIFSIVRDDHVADELAQDAMIRMLNGDFSGADPNRGRFRDLLKTSLRNMVKNHWKRSNRRVAASLDFDIAADSDDETASDDPWMNQWRSHLLDLAWSEIERIEREESSGFPYSTLKIKVDNPDANSSKLASLLGEKIGQKVTADSFRQKLKRARKLFFDRLIDEIRDGLDDPSTERIHDELIVLGIYGWLKNHVDKRFDD